MSVVFNEIIISRLENYSGIKKKQLKSFLEDLQQSGSISGMVGEFIYHNDCREFYIKHLEDLESIKMIWKSLLESLQPTDINCPIVLFYAGSALRNNATVYITAVFEN